MERLAPLPETEEDLVARIRRGDSAAFGAMMRRNNRRLFRLARSIVRDDAEAEEIVQESYVRAFTHFDGFEGAASLSTWLSRIALNEALGRQRRRRTTVDFDSLADSLTMSDSSRSNDLLSRFGLDNPEGFVARAEIRHLLEQAVDRLPQPFRTVFVLRAIEQMSVEEVAVALAIPKDTVKTRFHRAKRLLRQALGAEIAALLQDAFPFAGARCDRIMRRVLDRIGMAEEGGKAPL
jgi:RNA polymerase sigma-70 factor, ECF subfamily